MLESEMYLDAEAIFQTLETLHLSIDLLKDHKDSVIDMSISKEKNMFPDKNDNDLRNGITDSVNYFFEKIEPAISIWEYYDRIYSNYPLDFQSLEQVIKK